MNDKDVTEVKTEIKFDYHGEQKSWCYVQRLSTKMIDENPEIALRFIGDAIARHLNMSSIDFLDSNKTNMIDKEGN